VAEVLEPTRKPLDIQVTASEAGLDIDVRGSGPLPPARVAELARIAERLKLARLTRHGELVAQRAPPTITIGRARVTLPPGCLPAGDRGRRAALAALIVEGCGEAKQMADLFAGVGPFALRLAERMRVTGDRQRSGRDRGTQACGRTTTGLKPVETEVRDLFRRPLDGGRAQTL
jgi:23S rRNA (uracil1939-C5)-methyltransferase